MMQGVAAITIHLLNINLSFGQKEFNRGDCVSLNGFRDPHGRRILLLWRDFLIGYSGTRPFFFDTHLRRNDNLSVRRSLRAFGIRLMIHFSHSWRRLHFCNLRYSRNDDLL